MPSKASVSFDDQQKDITVLWEIHNKIGGTGQGKRPSELEVLNRAVIVFVAACWESYVENVLTEAFSFLTKHATTPDHLPQKLKNHIWAKLVQGDSDLALKPETAWKLGGDGWKSVLAAQGSHFMKDKLDKFHTPKSQNVGELFSELIGLKDIQTKWFWKKMSCKQATNALDDWMEMRGAIAHRSALPHPIAKAEGHFFLNHVQRLVEKTDVELTTFFTGLMGKSPF